MSNPPTSRDQPRPLRFVVFGASIVSDWGNPAATATRAVLRALVAGGHDALFLEERGNRPTVELLRARGSDALRAFRQRYPGLPYRTYDLPPPGLERGVWLSRELATADAVVVQDTAPPGVVDVVAAFDTRRVVRFLQLTGAESPPITDRFDRVLAPFGSDAPRAPGTLPFGPAVDETRFVREVGGGIVVVAYDDAETAVRTASTLTRDAPSLVTPGSVRIDGFRYVPEVELGAVYRRAALAVVAPDHASPLAAARVLLPLSYGCPAMAVETADRSISPLPLDAGIETYRPEDLPAMSDGSGQGAQQRGAGMASVPPPFTGTSHAARLVDVLTRTMAERWR